MRFISAVRLLRSRNKRDIMKYIDWKETDPQINLAFEEYVFNQMDQDESYFLLWQNDNAVIVGKHQNTIEEINQE